MSGPLLAPPAIETSALAKRYGSLWALQACSLVIPQGHVTALVGPNGAGKTTLLRMLAGLSTPTAGRAGVLGRPPEQSEEFLSSIGYLAQDIPLYKRLSADQHLEVGAGLNRRWDAAGARQRLRALGIPTDRPVSTLSGGQRAQVALGRPGQASPVAAARRAGGRPRPSGQKEVPHLAHRSGSRGRSVGGPVLPSSPRFGTGLRPPRTARLVRAQYLRRHRPHPGHPPHARRATTQALRHQGRAERGEGDPDGQSDQAPRPHRRPRPRPVLAGRRGRVEDIVLAYMGQDELEGADRPASLGAA